MLPNPDGLRCLHATRRALFHYASCFDLNDMGPVQLGFVFEQRDELSPRRILLVPSGMRLSQHPLHIQIFNEHRVVFPDEPRREFMLVVQRCPPNVTLDLRNLQSLFLVVVRSTFFP